jgi:predicted  nucleic acid-binding Zn-ribbon protein
MTVEPASMRDMTDIYPMLFRPDRLTAQCANFQRAKDSTMDFSKVLADITAVQLEESDRIDDLRDQRKELQGRMKRALDRLMYAELDTDMRLWTRSERDELRNAEEAFDEALAELNRFNAEHGGSL